MMDGAADLPDVSKCFRGIARSIHASNHLATLHGVVFDILVGSERHVGLAAVVPMMIAGWLAESWLAAQARLRQEASAWQPSLAEWYLLRQSVFALTSFELRRTRFALRSWRGCATRSPTGRSVVGPAGLEPATRSL